VWAGQAGPTKFFDDLWAYDPATNAWSRLPNDGAKPVARYGSCAAVGQDGRLWISHGFTEDGVRFSDTRAYHFSTGRWSDETPDADQPVVRCLHACWLTADGDLALYAGQTTGVRALGDLWRLTDGTWTRLDEDLPPDRNLPAVTRHGDDAIVFGGLGLDGDYLRDVYRVDGTTLAFEQLRPEGPRPQARHGAALIDDPGRSRVLLFGGTGSGDAFDDTWELTLP
jgi:N-acetylneuraminic acid mutarotase